MRLTGAGASLLHFHLSTPLINANLAFEEQQPVAVGSWQMTADGADDQGRDQQRNALVPHHRYQHHQTDLDEHRNAACLQKDRTARVQISGEQQQTAENRAQ